MTRTSVHIDNTDGFWHGSGDTYVRGRAFKDGALYRPDDLLSLVAETPVGELEHLIGELDGFYSIVHATGEAVFLAVDHVQSYPLFYTADHRSVFVSNDARWIKGRLSDPTVDPLLEFELLLTGVVTGRDTLYPRIKQLEAGEYAVIEPSGRDVSVTVSRHERFDHRRPRSVSEDELLDQLDVVVERSFERLAEVADGRQLAISLSGGPDSRLIACMLRRLGYENLVAFTYGFDGNWDSTVAVEVADALDIPCEVVPYDHEMWFEWFHSDERVDYYQYAFNFDVPPAIGTVPAMGELQRRGALDDDAIVLCGNLVPSRYDYPPPIRRLDSHTKDDLVDAMVDRYYSRWKYEDDEADTAFRSRLHSQVPDVEDGDLGSFLAAYKDWRLRNRNAKLMIMPEEYAFWGYDAWTPLWDAEYMRFWETVPVRQRADKRLHCTYVDRLYREVTGEDRPPASHVPPGVVGRLEGAIGGSPLQRIVRPIYDRLEEPYKRLTRESPYYFDPVATPGIMTEAQFEELCYSYDQDVHPFKALELLGCVSFDPPKNHAAPVEGVLDLGGLRAAEHSERRESLPWFQAAVDDEIQGSPAVQRSIGRS